MNHARQIRDQLEYLTNCVDIEIQSNPTDSNSIGKSICAGFFSHTARFFRNGIYKTISHQQSVHIHSDSCLCGQVPQYVIYLALVRTTKEYMRHAIRIEKQWLREKVSHFHEMNK
jgi:HrpA-like RNA helicase